MSELSTTYLKTKRSIVRIEVRDANGDSQIGTGFHIGDGLVVTARHAIKYKEGEEEKDYQIVALNRELDGALLTINRVLVLEDDRVDVAILETDFHSQPFPTKQAEPRPKRAPRIPIAWALDEWLGDDFVLSKVLILGYPSIPLTTGPFLVAAAAEVNALVSFYNGPYRHFVISSLARGGFSGGPIVDEEGNLLGIITRALIRNDKPEETGFCVAISVEPLGQILVERGPKPNFVDDDIWRKLTRPA